MFVGLAPVFIAMERAKTAREAFFKTWVYVFIGNSLICAWVANSIHDFARLPWLLSYPTVLLVSVTEQIAWPVMAALRHWVYQRFKFRPVLLTPVLIFFLDKYIPKIFPNTMGVAFYKMNWLCQAADIVGVVGLTAFLALTNELAAILWERKLPKKELRRHVTVGVTAIVTVFGYAIWRNNDIQQRKAALATDFKFLLIQPNRNPTAVVRDAENREIARVQVVQELIQLTEESLKINPTAPDLILWPETAVPYTYEGDFFTDRHPVTELILRFREKIRAPILFGTRQKVDGKTYNALFMMEGDPESRHVQVYRKSRLLLLGEKIPFAEWIPTLVKLLRKQGASTFAGGEGPVVFDHPKGKLGPMICLEGLYSDYVDKIARAGADILVNATNDAWFGNSQEPWLHLYLTAFRAIETRRPIVRVTTTGVSALIGIDGKVEEVMGVGERGGVVRGVLH